MKKRRERWWTTLKQAMDRELQKSNRFRRPQGDATVVRAATLDGDAKPGSGARSPRLWAFLLLCLVGSAVASFVIFKYIAPSIPHELIGTWQVTDGPLKDATLEFRWYGAAVATANVK